MSARGEINFYCAGCKHSWRGEPSRIEDAPEIEHHPFRYFSTCEHCYKEAPQVQWEKNLIKAWANATGPKTAEGKAATAANLEGHPTKEESLRTRFNAMKHGLNARTATYFPAKPDGYDFCKECEVDRAWCAAQPACAKKTELFLLHHAAFEQKNPRHLSGIYADLQASFFAVLQQVLTRIIGDGVMIEHPKYYTDKEGQVIVAEYVDEDGRRRVIQDVQAHPLFKPLGEMMSRNSLSLADMGMTQKVIEDQEQELGRLAHETAGQEELNAYRQRQVAALEEMAGLVRRANKQTQDDPILLEYQQENGG